MYCATFGGALMLILVPEDAAGEVNLHYPCRFDG